jgi:Bor protein
MKLFRTLAAVASCVALTGCFHQVFNTGLPPAQTSVTKSFHPTWIFGLVAAQPIDVRSTCTSGVALVSTRYTFPNWLATVVTIGIFTPHEVKVVCASRSAALAVPDTRSLAAGSSADEAALVLAGAIATAQRTGATVAIVLEPAATVTLSPETR